MTIDAATLPRFDEGATLEAGRDFVIRGKNFDNWPNEIVLGSVESEVKDSNSLQDTMMLHSRTSDSLTFRVRQTHTFSDARIWQFFGSPNTPPRTILEYDTM